MPTNDVLISNGNVGLEFSTSDDKIITFDINLEVYNENISEETVYICSKGDYKKLRTIFSATDWSVIPRAMT